MNRRAIQSFIFPSLAILGALLFTATFLLGCGGGGPGRQRVEPIQFGGEVSPPPENGVEPPPGEVEPRDRLDSYLADQASGLESWPSSTLGALAGSLTISGYTLIDPQSLEPIPPEQGLSDVPLRVVDPEDDIDCVTFPDTQGRFLFPDLPPVTSAVLNVQFVVAEDVDGDDRGIDTVECEVPVVVTAGRTTSVQLDIYPLSAPAYEDLEAPLDILGVPPVTVSYSYHGPDGSRQRSLAILRALGRVWLDSDLDGEFSSSDLQFADENANGLGDKTEEHLSGAAGAALEEYTVVGVILSVVGNIITIYSLEDMASIELVVNEATNLVSETGEEIPLTGSTVGRDAVAIFREYPDGHVAASLIMILSATGPHGPGGG